MKYLNEILGIRYPFIQGGMANIATGSFAAAVTNAGALGLIATGGLTADALQEQIHIAKKETNGLFGVNMMLLTPDIDQMADLVIEEGIRVITTGAGDPGKYMEKWKAAGITVFPVCASVALAKRMVRIGADAIIAEGGESGGHVGDMTTMTLVPQMVDAIDLPVIAAGGIADRRQLKAAYDLGAIGAQLGTCLLVSEECPIHDNYKQALIQAKDNSTVVTGRSLNAPVRVIKNPMSRKYLKLEKELADRMELEQLTLGSLRKAVFDGNVKEGSLMAGQVCGQLNSIRPLKEIFADLAGDENGLPAENSAAAKTPAGRRVAFLYAGQGSQCAGMGKDLYGIYPAFRKVIDGADPGFDLKKMMFEGSMEELSETQYTQPAMAAFAAGVTNILYQRGIVPEYAAGLSLGEYSALYSAGVFDADTLIRLTAFRGRAMQQAAEGHECLMCAILGLDASKVEEAVLEASSEGIVEVANYNTANQTVIAGERNAVKKAEELAKAAGAKRCAELKVSSAFHTSFMESASRSLHTYFENMEFGRMQFPVIFNTTALPLQEGETIPQLLEQQVKSPVRMKMIIEYLAEQGVDTIVEIGPGKTLAGFVKKTVKGITVYSVEDAASLENAVQQIMFES